MTEKFADSVFDTSPESLSLSSRYDGLRTRSLGIALTCIMALPIVFAGTFGWIGQKTILRQRIELSLQSISRLNLARQSELVEGTRKLLVSMAQARSIREGNWVACSEYTKRLNTAFDSYLLIGVVDLNGDLVCSSRPESNPVNIANSPFFQEAIKSRNFSVGYYVPKSATTGRASLPFSDPLYAPDGRLIGLVVANLDIEKVSGLSGGVSLPPGFEVTLTDWHGTVLAVSPGQTRDRIGLPLSDAAVLGAVKSRSSGHLTIVSTNGLEGDLQQVSIPMGNGLFIWTGLHINEVIGPLQSRFLWVMLGIVAFFVAMLGVVWMVSSFLVVAPIRHILESMKRIGEGDYDVNTNVPKTHLHELHIIHIALAAMARSLDRRRRQRVEALAANEDAREEMLGILNRMGDGFLVLDPEWKIRFENRSASAVLQRERGTLGDVDFWTLLSCDGLAKIRDEARRQIRMKYDWYTEDYHPAIGRWLEIRIYPSADSVGVFVRDTTETRRLFDELQQRERQNHELFASNPHPMAIYDVETLQLIAVNAEAVLLTEYSEHELLSMTLMDLSPLEDVERVRELVESKAKSGKLGGDGMIRRVLQKHGGILVVEVAGHSMIYEARKARIVMLVDVSFRIQKESKLRLENENLARNVNALADQIGRRDYLRGLAEQLAADTRKNLHSLRIAASLGHDQPQWNTLEDQLQLLGQIAWAKGRAARPEMIDISAIAEKAAIRVTDDLGTSGPSLEIAPNLRCLTDPLMVNVLLENLLAFVLRPLEGHPESWLTLDHSSAHQFADVFRLTVRCADLEAMHELHLMCDPINIALNRGNFSAPDIQFQFANALAQLQGGKIWTEQEEGDGLTLLIQLTTGKGGDSDTKLIQEIFVDSYPDEVPSD